MADQQLHPAPTAWLAFATWGKVAAAVFAVLLVASIIGLVWIDRAIADSKGQVQTVSGGQAWTEYITNENSIETDNWVQALTIDTEGRVWAGTKGGELKMIAPDGQVTTYNSANSGLSGGSVSAVAVDDQGRGWVGTEFDGLTMLAPDGTWKSYKADDSNYEADWVQAIIIDTQGRVWVGTSGGGLRVLEPDGSWTIYTSANSGLGYDYIETLTVDGRGRVWVGTYDNGIYVLAPDGQWTAYNRTNSDLKDERLNALATDQQGQVWVAAAYSGISVVGSDESWKHFSQAEYGLGTDALDMDAANIVTVAFDHQGQAWIGAQYGGLSVLTADNQWTSYTPSNSGLRNLSWPVFAFDQQGRVWIGDAGGLGVFDPNAGAPPQNVESLAAVKSILSGLSITAFGLMLIVLAVADITAGKRVRQFVVGFIGWPLLNAMVISMLDAILPSTGGFGLVFMAGLLATAFLALLNIVALIFLAARRRGWIAAGAATAFVASITVIWLINK
ncbi:MAG: hypothetical protein HYZ49_06165 [Chloroflexi bacterium]|nr:hypothetical protein [Chloroflexota bacterium]